MEAILPIMSGFAIGFIIVITIVLIDTRKRLQDLEKKVAEVDKPFQVVDKEEQPVYNPSYGDPEVKAYLDKMYRGVEE